MITLDVGVYVTLLNDEYIIPYCLETLREVFPQVKVLDFGSTDGSCAKVPEDMLIRCGIKDPQEYIRLKNEYSSKHDQVFWVDADEVYPVSVLQKLKTLIETDPDQIHTQWRNVQVDQNLIIYVEDAFIRGTAIWNPKYNNLVRAWPNERLSYTRCEPPFIQKQEHDPELFCWHGVMLNRSSKPEATARRKKRQHRHLDAIKRATMQQIDVLPWGDLDVAKYVP